MIAVSEGQDRKAVATEAKITPRQLLVWIHRFNQGGMKALAIQGKRTGRPPKLPKHQTNPAFEKILSACRGPRRGGFPSLNGRTPWEELTGEHEGLGPQARYFITQLRQKSELTVSATKVRKRIKAELGLDAGYSTVTRYLRKRVAGEKHARIARQAGLPGFIPKPGPVRVEGAAARKAATTRDDDRPGVEGGVPDTLNRPIHVPPEILTMMAENRARLKKVTRAEAAQKAKETAPRPAGTTPGKGQDPVDKAADRAAGMRTTGFSGMDVKPPAPPRKPPRPSILSVEAHGWRASPPNGPSS